MLVESFRTSTESGAINPALESARGALFAALVALVLPTVADTDLWGHVRFGLDALADSGLTSIDPYSFTSDRDWINHEWLAEVLMAAAYRAGAAVGLIALKAVVVVLALLVAALGIEQQHRRTWGSTAILAFAGLAGIVPLTLTMRPQVFSVLLFVLLLTIIRLVDAGRIRWLTALPLVFLVWANTHGGWMVGGATLAIWTVGALLARGRPLRWKMATAAAAASCAAATLINPYGAGLWAFLFETVGFSRSDIGEWSPISVHRELLIPWIATTALFATALLTRRGCRWSYVLIGLFLAYASFRVSRLGAFYSLAVALLIAPTFLTASDGAPDPALATGRLRGFSLAAATFTLVLLLFVTVNRTTLTCVLPHPPLGLDLKAAAFIEQHQLAGRMVVWFNWGEFVIWHFAPRLQVSMDGRRETVYSAETLDAHQRLWQAAPGADQYLAALQPDYVWIPPSLPLSPALPAWGWIPVFTTPSSTVWSRRALPVREGPPAAPDPCFPALGR